MNRGKPNEIQTSISHIDILFQKSALGRRPPSTNKHGTRFYSKFEFIPPPPPTKRGKIGTAPNLIKPTPPLINYPFLPISKERSRKQHRRILNPSFSFGRYTYPNINPMPDKQA
ncbi:hypothetical protein CDAR_388281 [Caerostris darwini]|uniref:Uncharacterized protein n=1 Tax=Caerostris darwini TaxID=1538125 RepID=A0AAV4WEZ2_9ARAC|nr:hypothetical protein CDAR_388281 [Caerostris darwini]